MSRAFLEHTMLGMTWEEIAQSVEEEAVVFLPIGVVEAHGPHLPLGTDIYLALDLAEEVMALWKEIGKKAVIAPPFYWGGVRALTRQFAGTFTSKKDTIQEALYDVMESLDRFGYKRILVFNAHGDGLHMEAILETIRRSNQELSIKTYWMEFADDIQNDGFTGEEEFLAIIPPISFDSMFTCKTELADSFDVHAGAFETATMQALFPESVRNIKIVGLSPTMLKGEEIAKWCNGEVEDKSLIPGGYCGDPASARDLTYHGEVFAKHVASGLADFFK